MSYGFYITQNPGVIRKMVGHPAIQPGLFDEDFPGIPLFDLKKVMDPLNKIYIMTLSAKRVGIAFFMREAGRAMIDFGFIPEVRGKHAKFLANSVLDAYKQENKVPLEGKIKRGNRVSLVFSKWLGFDCVGSSDKYIYVRCASNG